MLGSSRGVSVHATINMRTNSDPWRCYPWAPLPDQPLCVSPTSLHFSTSSVEPSSFWPRYWPHSCWCVPQQSLHTSATQCLLGCTHLSAPQKHFRKHNVTFWHFRLWNKAWLIQYVGSKMTFQLWRCVKVTEGPQKKMATTFFHFLTSWQC